MNTTYLPASHLYLPIYRFLCIQYCQKTNTCKVGPTCNAMCATISGRAIHHDVQNIPECNIHVTAFLSLKSQYRGYKTKKSQNQNKPIASKCFAICVKHVTSTYTHPCVPFVY